MYLVCSLIKNVLIIPHTDSLKSFTSSPSNSYSHSWCYLSSDQFILVKLFLILASTTYLMLEGAYKRLFAANWKEKPMKW